MTHFPLRELEARLQKVVTVASEEIGPDGKYVFRDETGEAFMWGPKPERYEFRNVETVADADHIMFLCPACFAKNNGSIGTHSVMATFAGRSVPDEAGTHDHEGKPSRWNVSGASLDDLVLTPSILLDASRKVEEGCHWHGFVGSSGIPPGHAG